MSLCGQFTAIHLFIYTHIWRVCPFLWKKGWCGDSITLKWPPGGRGMTEWMDDVISHIVKHCVYQQSINNTGWTSGPKKSREIEILNFCSSDWYLISYWYIALRLQKKRDSITSKEGSWELNLPTKSSPWYSQWNSSSLKEILSRWFKLDQIYFSNTNDYIRPSVFAHVNLFGNSLFFIYNYKIDFKCYF